MLCSAYRTDIASAHCYTYVGGYFMFIGSSFVHAQLTVPVLTAHHSVTMTHAGNARVTMLAALRPCSDDSLASCILHAFADLLLLPYSNCNSSVYLLTYLLYTAA
jgi:hypothetical protein